MLIRKSGYLLLCFLLGSFGNTSARCMPADATKTSQSSVRARLTTMFGPDEYVFEIIQPPGVAAACLAFWSYPKRKSARDLIELELPGQLGLHVVALNQEYLVVDSATATGSFESAIFVVRNGKIARLLTVASTTPPNYEKSEEHDFALIVDSKGVKKSVQLH
jgi:hypothetical protein